MVNADIGESSFFVMIMFYGNDCNLSVFCFADKLSHGAHGTVDTPGAGLKQYHGDNPQNGGGQHDAVEAKGKLGSSRRKPGLMVGPVPGNPEGPQKRHSLSQLSCAGEHQPGVPEHLQEHDQEEYQETISESFAFHPGGNVTLS